MTDDIRELLQLASKNAKEFEDILLRHDKVYHVCNAMRDKGDPMGFTAALLALLTLEEKLQRLEPDLGNSFTPESIKRFIPIARKMYQEGEQNLDKIEALVDRMSSKRPD